MCYLRRRTSDRSLAFPYLAPLCPQIISILMTQGFSKVIFHFAQSLHGKWGPSVSRSRFPAGEDDEDPPEEYPHVSERNGSSGQGMICVLAGRGNLALLPITNLFHFGLVVSFLREILDQEELPPIQDCDPSRWITSSEYRNFEGKCGEGPVIYDVRNEGHCHGPTPT